MNLRFEYGKAGMTTAIETDPFAELDVPEALQASLARHRANLACLVASLRSAGMTETQIELSVSVMIDLYKQELIRTIKELVG